MPKEIISQFKDKPKTKTAWWAFGLGLAVIFIPSFLGIFAAFIRPMIDRMSNESIGAIVGFVVGIVVFLFSISSLVVGIIAFRKGERSWVMWFGFIPAILVGIFWVFMIVGELLFPH